LGFGEGVRWELKKGEPIPEPADPVDFIASNQRILKAGVKWYLEESVCRGSHIEGERELVRWELRGEKRLWLEQTCFHWNSESLVEHPKNPGEPLLVLPRKLVVGQLYALAPEINLKPVFCGSIQVKSPRYQWEGIGLCLLVESPQFRRSQWLGKGLGELALQGGWVLWDFFLDGSGI
jgi:hypothetical protein